MSVQITSSEAQQNFGRVVDQALVEDDIIIERYGKPRVVIVGYRRYQQLLQAEHTLSGLHLTQPEQSVEAQQKGQLLAEHVRHMLKDSFEGTLEETMGSLRGRL